MGEARKLDFPQYSRLLALEVISGLTFGKPYGMLESGHDSIGIIEGRMNRLRYFHMVGTFLSTTRPMIHKLTSGKYSNMPWLDRLYYKNLILLWLGRMGWYEQTTETIPFAQKRLAARLSQEKQMESGDDRDESSEMSLVDLLDKFLFAKKQYPAVVDDFGVLGLTLSTIDAGSGTIATSFSAVVYHLLKNKDKMAKLMAELDQHFPPPDSVVTDSFEQWVVPFSTAKDLPYLDACLKETFRIHPSAGGQHMERVVTPGGAIINGEHVPGGTIVGMAAWTTQRHKPTYGDDVETFRPERWLEASSQQLSAMNRGLLTFGAGPNTCLGKNIAYLELYKMLPTLLRMYKVEQVKPEESWKIYNVGDPEPYDFYVRLRSRQV